MNATQYARLRSPWIWLGLGLALVYFRGLFLDVMDVDAAQYASISMEMLQNGQWLQVQHRGGDYLDKPPLLFWLSGASYALFGLSNWAYKLPSLLAALAGVWAVFGFAKRHYGVQKARQAAFILASCMGMMVITNDVRTDTMLLGFSACAVWQLSEYQATMRWLNLLSGFGFIGLAMLAKGPIGLVMPVFALGTHLLIQRDWRSIFQWKWLPGLAFTALILVPMCWGLWQQFDLHPEKVVNDKTGVSGLRFYFWEQSFGRITGENVWKNNTSGFYFMHVYLWAFLPWSLLLPGALWRAIWQANLFQKAAYQTQEYYALGGFLLTFIALSQSQYKLPHYIFITLPWAAVLLVRAWTGIQKWQWGLLYFTGFLALSVAFSTLFFVFSTGAWALAALAIVGVLALVWRIFQHPFPIDSDVFVQRGVWMALIFGFVLNFHFYPQLLLYQGTPKAARFANAEGIPADKMYFFQHGSHAMDFYNRDVLENLESPQKVQAKAQEQGNIWVYTTESGRDLLTAEGVPITEVQAFSHFQVALLKPKFLNPATRAETLQTYYLLRINHKI